MSLSNSTLIIFLFLLPGLLFRLSLYQGELVKRPITSVNGLWAIVSIILYSCGMFMLFFLISELLIWLFNLVSSYTVKYSFAEISGKLYLFDGGVRIRPINFLYKHPFKVVFLAIFAILVVFLASEATKFLARRIKFLGRLMYGPLAPLLSMESNGVGIITCFVLTKVADGNKRLMYAGYVNEVSLKESGAIDHIVLSDPMKFYLRLGRDVPASTLSMARQVSSSDTTSHMYIEGCDIENVHFEGFYFPEISNELDK